MKLSTILAIVSSLFVILGCSDDSVIPSANLVNKTTTEAYFRDFSETVGLRWEHHPGEFTKYEMISVMGSGGALVDYDRDGCLDVYLVDGGTSRNSSNGLEEYVRKDRLYRQFNDLKLVDVSHVFGSQQSGFGMSACWGDYDNDGFPDLFLTGYGPNHLYQNMGDGRFQEIDYDSSGRARSWSTAANWTDYNGDGFLDLVVINYVDYIPHQYCEGEDGQQDFCGPSAFAGAVDQLLLNSQRAEGELFIDQTESSGLGNARGKGLGLVCRDFNADGLIDFYVTNDGEPNFLWVQQEDSRFREQALQSGVATNFLGEFEASMGVVSSDFNRDGVPDLFVTHLSGETNSFYLSDQAGIYRDATAMSGLGPPSLPHTSFGIGMADFDHDGMLDLAIGNGHVKRPVAISRAHTPQENYASNNQLFRQDRAAGFLEVSSPDDSFCHPSEISRAVITGDYDRDGDMDLLVTNCSGPALLHENHSPKRGESLTLRLVDTKGNREAIGARVRLTGDSIDLTREVDPYQGYLSTGSVSPHFGLGSSLSPLEIEVRWSDGVVQHFRTEGKHSRLILVRDRGVMRESWQPESVIRDETQ